MDRRPTETFPVVQRGGIKFFRRVTRGTANIFREVGRRAFFLRDTARAMADPATFMPEVFKHMKNIGVDSVPLAAIVAAFIGAVISLQVYYQLFSGVQLSVVGLSVRQMIILELGPLLTGLVMTGRVGARMTAEIGTMRVTEQIDALETLAYDPIAYLVVPRLIACLVMMPVLTIVANAVGILSGFATAVTATPVLGSDFRDGLLLGFTKFQVIYSLLKAILFGFAIAMLCSYEGYTTDVGAEGVGRSTAKAVVVTSVAVLVLDALTAALLAPFLR